MTIKQAVRQTLQGQTKTLQQFTAEVNKLVTATEKQVKTALQNLRYHSTAGGRLYPNEIMDVHGAEIVLYLQ